MLQRYTDACNIALPFLFSCSVALAGYPLILIAPTGGYKSTIVEAVRQYLQRNNEYVMEVSKLNLGNLRGFSDEIIENINGLTVVNDDFSHIAIGGVYNVEKTGELIGALSYKGSYRDKNMGIDIMNLKRLGFVTGCQPYWLNTIIKTQTWENFYRQRFIRYYILPEFPSTFKTDEYKIIDKLVSRTPSPKKIPSRFYHSYSLRKALCSQLGDRGMRAYERIAPRFYSMVGGDNFKKLSKVVAHRLSFENVVVNRYFDIDFRNWVVRSYDIEYAILNVVCRHNPITYDELKVEMNWRDDSEKDKGVPSSVSQSSLARIVRKCEELGWVKRVKFGDGVKIFLSEEMKKNVRIKE